MEPSSQPAQSCSWCVVTRFGLKLTVFALVGSVQIALGHPSAFFELTGLAAAFCAVLALQARAPPLSRSLNYWDEALVFGLISHFGKGILALG